MSNEIVTTRDTQLEKQRVSDLALSLTEFGTTSEPKIAAGSVVEIGGSLFVVTVDEAITGWAGIGNDTDAYIRLVPDGGGADFAAEFTTTAPTWSASKQGWYYDIDRYVGGLHRGAGAGDYESKWIYQCSQDNNASHRFYGDGTVEFDDGIIGDLDGGIVETGTGAETLLTKVIEIGDWNMDLNSEIQISISPIDISDIRVIQVLIYSDAGAFAGDTRHFSLYADGGSGWHGSAGETDITLNRAPGGLFDNANFDATSYNRGLVTIWYAE